MVSLQAIQTLLQITNLPMKRNVTILQPLHWHILVLITANLNPMLVSSVEEGNILDTNALHVTLLVTTAINVDILVMCVDRNPNINSLIRIKLSNHTTVDLLQP